MDRRATAELLHRGFRYAMALTADDSQAEDLLQDAWTSVLAAEGRRDAPYLFRAIRSRWIDAHRRRKGVVLEILPESLAAGGDHGARVADHDALHKALATVRPEEREALYLCVVEGHTAAEAAEITGRPRNTVLSLMHRGRAKLRAWFSATDREVMP
ncbi:MAG: RNA polymerase sigma factor [Myxococcales bacterium]|nr:RNA polymerase sigma factor [Myxococcales bacterium]